LNILINLGELWYVATCSGHVDIDERIEHNQLQSIILYYCIITCCHSLSLVHLCHQISAGTTLN